MSFQSRSQTGHGYNRRTAERVPQNLRRLSIPFTNRSWLQQTQWAGHVAVLRVGFNPVHKPVMVTTQGKDAVI